MKVINLCFIFLCITLVSGLSIPFTCSQKDCTNDQIKCKTMYSRNGRHCVECVNSNVTCNGFKNCYESEDENVGRCGKIKCKADEYQCFYGACVPKKLYCDGVNDCSDGSDEPLSCENSTAERISREWIGQTRLHDGLSQCQEGQYRCVSGQCIDEAIVCDGTPHCEDKSDEHVAICGEIQCTTRDFQCKYGACVSKKSKCDGVKDCDDKSDEFGCSSSPKHNHFSTEPKSQSNNSMNLCEIPNVDGVIFSYEGSNTTLSPGTQINHHQLVFEDCKVGYHKAYRSRFKVCRPNGKWTPVTDKLCLKMCPALISDTLNINCSLDGDYANCSNPSIPDTIATTSCKPMHFSIQHYVQPTLFKLVCQSNGTWNNTLYACSPFCGKAYNTDQPLIRNGKNATVEMAPWNVGVYKISTYNDSNKYVLKCGGSLISKNLVVSAAHCFWEDNIILNISGVMVNEHTKYKIAVGKYTRDFSLMDNEFTQIINVEMIYINQLYAGLAGLYTEDIAVLVLTNKVVLSNSVAPICMDWNLKYTVSNGDLGKIVGWGDTEAEQPSPVLSQTYLPFIDSDRCYKLSSKTFKKYLTLDKFCAGYEPNNKSSDGVQKGEYSGSGFTFVHTSTHFLTGVVSVCDLYSSIGVLIDVRHYISWIRALYDLHVIPSERVVYNPQLIFSDPTINNVLA